MIHRRMKQKEDCSANRRKHSETAFSRRRFPPGRGLEEQAHVFTSLEL